MADNIIVDNYSPPSSVQSTDEPLQTWGANVGGVVGKRLENVSGWQVFFTLLAATIVYDQVKYIWSKGSICGPAMKIPFMGPFLDSVNPSFEKYYNKWMSGPLSCVSVFHKFVVIASTRDLSRKIFQTSSEYVSPCVVDVARKILRPNNWVFLSGKQHLEYRRGLNNLFNRSSLKVYLPAQEAIYDEYFKSWIEQCKDGKPRQFMGEFRDINCAVSLRTFCGHYITDDAVKGISEDYFKITAALELVNFPIVIPFTKTWYGKKCADYVITEFSKCAKMSKEAMFAGKPITCTMDQWVMEMINVQSEVKEGDNHRKQIRLFSDEEIALTIFTFLFASQDASSSASTWQFQLLADRPDVLEKLREEQLRVRDGDPHKPLDLDMIDQMVYTRAIVKEQLRYRPPVIMVPYQVNKAFNVTPDYTVPKGSMIIPTTYPALHDPEVYVDPESFNPDRWLPGGEAEAAKANWLVFGVGPHVCLGQNYAIINFMAMIGKASLMLDWEHFPTVKSEQIKVFATIFPEDDCWLSFKERIPYKTES